MVLAGPFAAAAVLLVVAGVGKVRRPRDTARALTLLGLPLRDWSVRLIGAGEVALGVAALSVDHWAVATLVALAYAAFAGVVALALVRGGPLSSCGCFGKPDTPPTRLHLGLNLGAVAVAATAPAPLAAVVAEDSARAVPFVALVALTAWFTYLAIARLAPLRSAAA